jgi:hypothetical protein
VTEISARNILAAELEEKENKKREAENKKQQREKTKEVNTIKRDEALKKRIEKKAASDKAKEAKAAAVDSSKKKVRKPRVNKKALNDDKNCLVCKSLFKSFEAVAQVMWRGCEQCANWYCFDCHTKLPPIEATADFICTMCRPVN